MTDAGHLKRHAGPVIAAEALLAHHITDQAILITDQAILNYLAGRWDLSASDAISALAAARVMAEDPTARTALPPDIDG